MILCIHFTPPFNIREQIAILLQVHKTLGPARPFPKLYLIALAFKPGERAPTCIKKTQLIGEFEPSALYRTEITKVRFFCNI